MSKLDDGALQAALNQMDENSLFDLYDKMNGTNIANDIEEVIFDTGHDEEANSWENIFGDYGSMYKRKKRQAKGKETDKDKNRPKDFEEKIAPMMAMGLQGFLMMDGKDMEFRLPKVLSKVPDCLREILWESGEESETGLCARVPDSLRSKLKELMMLVLKREISPKFMKINWPELMQSLAESDFAKELINTVMSKAMVPVEEGDILEVLTLVKNNWKKAVDRQNDPESKAILNLVTDLLTSLESPTIVSLITEVLKEIQGESAVILAATETDDIFSEMAFLKKDLVMLEGEMGPAPDGEVLCESYVRSRLVGGGGGGEKVWLNRGGAVMRGEWCPLTGAWYWTRLALCGCSSQKCQTSF